MWFHAPHFGWLLGTCTLSSKLFGCQLDSIRSPSSSFIFLNHNGQNVFVTSLDRTTKTRCGRDRQHLHPLHTIHAHMFEASNVHCIISNWTTLKHQSTLSFKISCIYLYVAHAKINAKYLIAWYMWCGVIVNKVKYHFGIRFSYCFY